MNRWVGILLLCLATHEISAINHGAATDASETTTKSETIDSRDSSPTSGSEQKNAQTPTQSEEDEETSPQSLKEMIGSLEIIAMEESPREAKRRLEIVKALFEVTADELSEANRTEIATAISTAESSIAQMQARDRFVRDGEGSEFGKLGPDGRPLVQTANEVPRVPLTSLLVSQSQESTAPDMEKRITRLITSIVRLLWRGAKKATVAIRSAVRESDGDSKDSSGSLSSFVAGFFHSGPAEPESNENSRLASAIARLLGFLMLLLFLLCGVRLLIKRLRS